MDQTFAGPLSLRELVRRRSRLSLSGQPSRLVVSLGTGAFRGPGFFLAAGASATMWRRCGGRVASGAVALACGVSVVCLCMRSGGALIAPFLWLAAAGRLFNSRLGPRGPVLFEGPPGMGSSRAFYLERKFA